MPNLFDKIQEQIKKNLQPVVYFESYHREDILKKAYKKSSLTEDICLEFWNGYNCTLSPEEFKNVLENFGTVGVTYFDDLTIQLANKTNTSNALEYKPEQAN